MEIRTGHRSWECLYVIDDATGALESISCMPLGAEPPGVSSDPWFDLGDQDTAGEEDQSTSAEWNVA